MFVNKIKAIPSNILQKADKILFISHLALGDFTYLQNCILAVAKAYPHLKIDFFVDEMRRTENALLWPLLEKYVVYDWLENCSYIHKIYKKTYSAKLYEASITEAIDEHYPIVVSLSIIRRDVAARLARRISPKGFVAGQVKLLSPINFRAQRSFAGLDSKIPRYRPTAKNLMHVSALYASWFEALFQISIPPEERFPFVDIPEQWQQYADRKFSEWNIQDKDFTIFINGFSKARERTWALWRVVNLVIAIRQRQRWNNMRFIINATPDKLYETRLVLQRMGVDDVYIFSAEENFFQLPAVLAKCHLVISVETAVMHLANAVHVPVVALMRNTTPEWTPVDADNSKVITVTTPFGVVNDISVDEVAHVVHSWQHPRLV